MNVLLAEDDALLRSIMMEFLEFLDCDVQAVVNGAEAVEAIRVGGFDAVFMDCEMPVMDGLSAAKAVVEGGEMTGGIPPIIALTGHTDAADHARCLEAGMVAVLTKPVELDDLQAALNRFAQA